MKTKKINWDLVIALAPIVFITVAAMFGVEPKPEILAISLTYVAFRITIGWVYNWFKHTRNK